MVLGFAEDGEDGRDGTGGTGGVSAATVDAKIAAHTRITSAHQTVPNIYNHRHNVAITRVSGISVDDGVLKLSQVDQFYDTGLGASNPTNPANNELPDLSVTLPTGSGGTGGVSAATVDARIKAHADMPNVHHTPPTGSSTSGITENRVNTLINNHANVRTAHHTHAGQASADHQHNYVDRYSRAIRVADDNDVEFLVVNEPKKTTAAPASAMRPIWVDTGMDWPTSSSGAAPINHQHNYFDFYAQELRDVGGNIEARLRRAPRETTALPTTPTDTWVDTGLDATAGGVPASHQHHYFDLYAQELRADASGNVESRLRRAPRQTTAATAGAADTWVDTGLDMPDGTGGGAPLNHQHYYYDLYGLALRDDDGDIEVLRVLDGRTTSANPVDTTRLWVSVGLGSSLGPPPDPRDGEVHLGSITLSNPSPPIVGSREIEIGSVAGYQQAGGILPTHQHKYYDVSGYELRLRESDGMVQARRGGETRETFTTGNINFQSWIDTGLTLDETGVFVSPTFLGGVTPPYRNPDIPAIEVYLGSIDTLPVQIPETYLGSVRLPGGREIPLGDVLAYTGGEIAGFSLFLGYVDVERTVIPNVELFLGSVEISTVHIIDKPGDWYANIPLPDAVSTSFDIYNDIRGTLHIVNSVTDPDRYEFSVERSRENERSIRLYGRRDIELVQLTAVDTELIPGRPYVADTTLIDSLLDSILADLGEQAFSFVITIPEYTPRYADMLTDMRIGSFIDLTLEGEYDGFYNLIINSIDYTINPDGWMQAVVGVSRHL